MVSFQYNQSSLCLLLSKTHLTPADLSNFCFPEQNYQTTTSKAISAWIIETCAHPRKHPNVRSAGQLRMGLTRPTSWLTGYHPSWSILPKVSVCDQAACRASETASRRELQGSGVTPVPTVAEGACLCSLSPQQCTHGVRPQRMIETE